MSLVGEELAQRRLVQAFFLDGTLALFATGQLPLPGYAVGIQRLTPRTDPPQFAIVQHRIAGLGTAAATAYTVSRLFAVAACPASVVVHHGAGRDSVCVADIRGDCSLAHAVTAGDIPIPYVFPPSCVDRSQAHESAVGYSVRFDFAEALREAVAALPPVEPTYAEYPQSVRVMEIGVETGGVANFHHLFVRVQRHPDPTVSMRA